MNARFGEVDHDLLADYVGGALDGTAEAGAVAARVAEDPAWARAHEELTAALDAVGADLAALSAVGPMPDDVAARIDAALAAAGAEGERPSLVVLSGGRTDDPANADDPDADADDPDANSPDIGQLRRARGARRRKWAGWASGAAAAAVLVVIGALSVNSLLTGGARDNATSTAGGKAAAPYRADSGAESQSVPGQISAGPQVVSTGTDYRRDTLPKAAALRPGEPPRAAASGPGADTGGGTPEPLVSTGVPPALAPFTADAARLRDCLEAVVVARGGSPLASVSLVDLATFEGRPAVIVVLRGPGDQRVVWASGPDCGTPAGGADTIWSSAVR